MEFQSFPLYNVSCRSPYFLFPYQITHILFSSLFNHSPYLEKHISIFDSQMYHMYDEDQRIQIGQDSSQSSVGEIPCETTAPGCDSQTIDTCTYSTDAGTMRQVTQ